MNNNDKNWRLNALEIKNLRKDYGATRAVDDISLTLEKGEFFGFLGPNGAGKTTTIHCITGITNIDGGTIKLFGKDVVRHYREARKKVGLAPQEFNVEFFGKVWKILDYMGGYYGMKKSDRAKRITLLLNQFGLAEHAQKQFRELSGGLKRRLVLARAMIHDPEFLILDEPTAGVDVELRHELWDYLRRANKGGTTILLTSHYLEEIEMLASRVAIINKGKIVMNEDKQNFIRDGRTLEDHYLAITKGETY